MLGRVNLVRHGGYSRSHRGSVLDGLRPKTSLLWFPLLRHQGQALTLALEASELALTGLCYPSSPRPHLSSAHIANPSQNMLTPPP